MRFKNLILALMILLLSANLAAAKSNIVSETLPNGAKVFVLEDNNSPLVAIQIWVKTGGVNESYKTRGMSHFLEHLLFKGTKKRKVGEIDRELDSIGATNNAATYYDYTFYQATGASCYFDKMLEIEVDGVLNSSLLADEVEKERKVVIEEIKMGEDNPYRVMFKSIHKGLFDNLNYAYPVIGFEQVIQNVPRDIIYQYYKEKYNPKNMSFVVVGNIKPEAAVAKIKDALKDITTEYAANEPLDSTYESQIEKPRYEKIAMDTEKSYVAIAYRGASAMSEDTPAFEILNAILSDGTSSRLNMLLREKNKLVESISCANWNFASNGVFVAFMLMDLKNLDKAKELFFGEIENVKKGVITDEELEKAKNQIETAFILAHQNYEGMAEFLGETVTIANLEKYNTYMESIKKVKKEDVTACANKYLRPESHVMVVIEPKKASKKMEVGKLENNFMLKTITIAIIFLMPLAYNAPLMAQTSEVQSKVQAPAAQQPPVTAPATAPAAVPAPAQPAAAPQPAPAPAPAVQSGDDAIKSLVEQIKKSSAITEDKLANGIKIIYRKNTCSDMVVLKLASRAGSIYETEKNNGISCLLYDLIKKGNARMNAEEIARNIEQTGAILKTDVSKNLGTITLVSTTKSFEKNFEILSECVLTSNFPPAEVEKEKQFLVGALKAENDKMDAACAKLFYKTMFSGHPYALHHYGSVESVPKITKGDVAKLHKSTFTPENMTFVVVGNVEFDYVKKVIEAKFGALKPVPNALKTFEEANKKIAEGVKSFSAPKEAKEFKDKAQAFIYYGFVTEGVESKDYGALKMLSTVLGSGMSSRLFSNLRDKESLAYQVTAYYQTLRGNSALIALMGTQPQKYDQAVAGLKREIEVFKNELISEEEYSRAKNKLVGNYALQRNTMEDQAEFLSLWEGLGLGAKFEDEYLTNVLAPTREDIQKVARKYFDSNKFVLSVIYPEAKEKKAAAPVNKGAK